MSLLDSVDRAESQNGDLAVLDFALAAIGPCLAGFCTGQSLGNPGVGTYMVSLVLIGTILSAIIRKYLPMSFRKADGFVYAVLALSAVFGFRYLNKILPGDGFPFQLMVMGWLAWILMLGSFAMWRDGTILFQAIPTMALFGLIGTIDTFKPSTIAFFVFLLCLATVFARAHARSMFSQAVVSGYPFISSLRKGPWRWMAGPEWALASAALVVVVSIIGAPILQESVKSVSGFVTINVPIVRNPATTGLGVTSSSDSTNIGRGPVKFKQEVVLKAGLDVPRYLRSNTYSFYSGRGWLRFPPTGTTIVDAFDNIGAMTKRVMKSPARLEYTIELVGGFFDSLPVPGEPSMFAGQTSLRLMPLPDGTVRIQGGITQSPEIRGRSFIAPSNLEPTDRVVEDLPTNLKFLCEADRIPASIVNKTREVTTGATNDYDKALRIKKYIQSVAKYNLNAAAIDRNKDPIAAFLFETHEGYCDLFASAMTVMARAAGIPARYVAGYYPNLPDRDPAGKYLVRDSDAHAWSELLFKDVGWVVMDATDGAESVEGGGRGDKAKGPFWEQPWFTILLDTLIVAVLISGAIIAFIVHKRSKLVRLANLGEVARSYQAFEKALHKVSKRPRLAHQTPDEYIELIADNLGETRWQAKETNDRYVYCLYSGASTTTEDLSKLSAATSAISNLAKKKRKS